DILTSTDDTLSFFCNHTATTEIYTLSLHDALPIYAMKNSKQWIASMEAEERVKTGIKTLKIGYNKVFGYYIEITRANLVHLPERSEEHTSELQSRENLVCRLLLEKKKKQQVQPTEK